MDVYPQMSLKHIMKFTVCMTISQRSLRHRLQNKSYVKEIVILGRVVRYADDSIEYEADPNTGNWCWSSSISKRMEKA